MNVELVTLFRVVKNHLDEFVRYLRWMLVARDEFERLKEAKPETLTDIQRAIRFFYLLKAGYASRIKNPTFSVGTTGRSNFNLLRIEEELSQVHLRLVRVYIENLPFEKFIPRFDRPDTFFYLDPPYLGFENCYGDGIFRREDFTKLNELVKGLKGKFILSINDHPEIRLLFKGFRIKKEATLYTAAKTTKKKVNELVISNF